MILQRINLGMFALLGDLAATADWRAIAEEIWPFVQAPPSTPMGAAEAGWRAARTGAVHLDRLVRLSCDPRDRRLAELREQVEGPQYLAGR